MLCVLDVLRRPMARHACFGRLLSPYAFHCRDAKNQAKKVLGGRDFSRSKHDDTSRAACIRRQENTSSAKLRGVFGQISRLLVAVLDFVKFYVLLYSRFCYTCSTTTTAERPELAETPGCGFLAVLTCFRQNQLEVRSFSSAAMSTYTHRPVR